jgi:hypothetical protein
MFKLIYPPYKDENMFTTRETPYGYKDEGYTGKGSAKKSIQILGGLPPSKVENLNLGFISINIDTENGKPVISFVSNEQANTGSREQTIGMGEGQIPVEKWREAKSLGMTKGELVEQLKTEKITGNPIEYSGEIQASQSEAELQHNLAVQKAMLLNPEKKKIKKTNKDWWDEPAYQNPPDLVYGSRYYRGRRLLPPSIGGNI